MRTISLGTFISTLNELCSRQRSEQLCLNAFVVGFILRSGGDNGSTQPCSLSRTCMNPAAVH